MLPIDILHILGRGKAMDTQHDMLDTLQAFGSKVVKRVLDDPEFVASWLATYFASERMYTRIRQVPFKIRQATIVSISKRLLTAREYDIDNILWDAVDWMHADALSDILTAIPTNTTMSLENTIETAAEAGRDDLVARLLEYSAKDDHLYSRAREFALSGAIKGDNVSLVKDILDTGYDCSNVEVAYNEPIDLLLMHDSPNLEIMKQVVAAGADIPDYMEEPLYHVICSQNEAALLLLARTPSASKYFENDLEYAWGAGMVDAVRMMLSRNASIARALEWAVYDNDMTLMKFLCDNNGHVPIACSALSAACRLGALEMIDVLIDNGADPGRLEDEFYFFDPPLKTAWEEAELHSPQCHEHLRAAIARL